MIRPMQIRAARALLGLSQTELAKKASIGVATLQRLEMAGGELRGSARTIWKLQKTLESAGIVFLDEEGNAGPGVRLRNPLP
jgi:transcriptional regulator with XRE-family HTH domain